METSAGQDQVRELFERYLEEQGHRKTPERFAILAEVSALYVHMKGRNYRVSRATLYNTMELLIDCGLVRRHQFGDKTAQFEKCYRIRQHDHVILADTGEVLEFCDPRIQQITSTLEELFGIEVLHHSLHVFARRKTADNGESTSGRPTVRP